MEEPIYDFTFKMKYRKISPIFYTCVFVLGLFCIPSIIAGGFFILYSAVEGVDDKNLFLAILIFLFLIPLLFMIFAVRLWCKESNNRYIFYDRNFKVICNGGEVTVNYSDITEIKEVKGHYFIYISDNRAFVIGKCLDNITTDEFERFLIVKTNIRPKK